MSKKDQQMSFSDFNLQKLTTSELSEHIRASIKVGSNVAIFGRRGTGKTEISKQEIANADMQEVYINLSVLERVDMGGYPDLISPAEKRRNFVEFLLPKFYQPMIEGNKPVVALLDEVDKADPSLWAPLLEFVQFRSINGKPLPNLAAIIMTGNLLSEGGNRPSLPLLDRAEKFLVEADATSWLNWAGRSGKIHPSITAYIHDKPTDLFGAVDPEDRYADPSPRGWARASELLFKGEKQNWSTNLMHKKVCGCVGKDAGLKYSLYYDHYQVILPMIERLCIGENILTEFKKLEPTKQIIACMIACARLATKLDKAKESKSKEPVELKYVGKFLSSINSPEKVLISVRSQIQLDRILDWHLEDHPFWKDLIDTFNCKNTI